MKRLLFLVLLCSPLLFTSCEEKYYGAYVETHYIPVSSSDWRDVGTYGQPGFFIKARFSAPYITPDVIDNGAVVVYAIFSDADVQLPYVLTRDVGYTIIEMLGYQLKDGVIEFTIDNSDFKAEPYSQIEFKIVVIR
ncbi:MAG: hypothetical protein LBG19_09675 [Prevotellaceae bacterium]|jgi:hypothetical protein|nr:hypothetical protein [Prevotellaceae bacterium]